MMRTGSVVGQSLQTKYLVRALTAQNKLELYPFLYFWKRQKLQRLPPTTKQGRNVVHLQKSPVLKGILPTSGNVNRKGGKRNV